MIPALREQPEVAEEWEPLILAGRYDQRFVPAEQISGVIIGMAVADAFCASRLGDESGLLFGGLSSGVDTAELIERARPTT